MIEKLRIKFIIITICSITAVLTIIMGSINIASYHRVNRSADATLVNGV